MSATLANSLYVVNTEKRSITHEVASEVSHDSDDNSRGNKRQKKKSDGGRVKWVSGNPDKDTVPEVSRFITGAARNDAVVGFPVSLHGKYDKSVNTCLKACVSAIPRCAEKNDDQDGCDVGCELSFRENRNELTVKCVLLADEAPTLDDDDDDDHMEGDDDSNKKLMVSKKTDYKELAGALAGIIREEPDGHVVRIAAIGPECVFTAARAIAVGNEYLRRDNKNLITIPRFTKVKFDPHKDETNVLELCVFSADTMDDE